MNVPDTRPFFKPGRPAYHTVPIRVRHLRNARIVSQLFFLGMWFVFFFLCRAQEHLPVRPDLFLVSDPLVAMLMGQWLLGEELSPDMLIAGAIILAGVAMILYRPWQKTI